MRFESEGIIRPPAGKGHFDRFFVCNGMANKYIRLVEARIYLVTGGELLVRYTAPIPPFKVQTVTVPLPNGEDVLARIVTVSVVYDGGSAWFQKEIPENDGETYSSMVVGLVEHNWGPDWTRWTFASIFGSGGTLYPLGDGEQGLLS
jgi:hypothetical protein